MFFYQALNFVQDLTYPLNKDPFLFKERLTMPKVIVSSAGDEFFLPDDSHYWLSEMPGPVYFRLLPNAEHTTLLSYGF